MNSYNRLVKRRSYNGGMSAIVKTPKGNIAAFLPTAKAVKELFPNRMVDIRRLSKKYNKKANYAVKDLNLVCYAGEIVGILGHNGAGKSTTLKCLTGMIPFEEGEILINGKSIKSSPVAAKKNFGFVTDNHSVFVKMTGMQYLNFIADMYGVDKTVRKERIAQMEECFKLGDKIYNLINSYSHGMKQKICMMGSIIHRPKVWILDEPMIGLDPATAFSVTEFMRAYVKEGNTILFSSHNLDSVQKLCNRAIMINHGRKVADLHIQTFLADNPGVDLEKFFLSDATNR